jgi:hypothetical protein
MKSIYMFDGQAVRTCTGRLSYLHLATLYVDIQQCVYGALMMGLLVRRALEVWNNFADLIDDSEMSLA